MGARRRRVVWTATALDELDKGAAHIAEDAPLAAARLVSRILDAAASLDTLGERGVAVSEYRDPEVRQLLVSRYRVIYRATESEVFILGVLHQRQSLDRWKDA